MTHPTIERPDWYGLGKEIVIMNQRAEHVEWCKRRAMEYFDRGDLNSAVTSMMSDMRKRADTSYPDVLDTIGMMELMNGNRDGVRRWIEGFNDEPARNP